MQTGTTTSTKLPRTAKTTAPKKRAPKKRAPKKRAPLTHERILHTALRLADKDGVESLSMRKLASALKVEAMSLYNHVGGKDDILDGLVELVVAEFAVPVPADDWRATMTTRAHVAHAALMRHPWATMLLLARLNTGPKMLRYVDATIGCLRAAGFSYPLADHASSAVDAFIYGFTLQTLHFPLEPGAYAHAAQGFLPMLPVEQFPHLHGMALEVIAGRHDGVQHLDHGLQLLLDGFERLQREASPSSTR